MYDMMMIRTTFQCPGAECHDVQPGQAAGPAVAGIMLEKFGAGFCFLLNAASFIAVIGSLRSCGCLPKK